MLHAGKSNGASISDSMDPKDVCRWKDPSSEAAVSLVPLEANRIDTRRRCVVCQHDSRRNNTHHSLLLNVHLVRSVGDIEEV